MTRYGLPYKGSKNKIAKRLIEFIPRTENFVDMMCGGASVSQCIKEHRPETNVHLNDVDEQLIEFLRLIDGNGWHGIEHFISHDEFFRLKDSRFDVSVCFSFGNDRRTYLYSWNKEFLMWRLEDRLIKEGLPESYERFLKEKNKYRDVDVKYMRAVQRISSIFRFQERMHGKFASISCGTYFDYRFSDGMTPDNTVVYCDIPYRNTESRQYSERFHHERFYWWVRNSRYVCVTSEFSMPSDFVRVGEIGRPEICCKPTNGKRDMTVEGLFVHRDKVREYERMMGS